MEVENVHPFIDAARDINNVDMEDMEDIEEGAILAFMYHYRRRMHMRRLWVRPWISRRLLFGDYENLMAELQRESQGDFVGFMRMDPELFHELLQRHP